jgi:membrane protease YdiL (CAAX protease family)
VLWGVALFIFTGFVVAPLFFALLRLLTGEDVVPPRQQLLPADPETLHIVLGGISAIVAAPIGEELFFRGLLHTALRGRMGFWVAAVISSAIFALVHAILLLMPLFFVVGLGLAYLYERRGTLLAPIAAHGGFNVIGYVFIVATG